MNFDGSHYVAFVLTDECRRKLLEQFPPKYKNVRAHHVTVAYNFTEEDIPKIKSLVEQTRRVRLMTYLRYDGLEFFKVAVDGRSKRPVDSWYHLTLSFEEGRSSSEVNEKIHTWISHEFLQYTTILLDGSFQSIPKTV